MKPRELSQLTQEAFSGPAVIYPHLAVGASGLVGKVETLLVFPCNACYNGLARDRAGFSHIEELTLAQESKIPLSAQYR